MASEVFYAEVSPKGRVHLTSKTSDTGDPVDTYAEVNVKVGSDRPDSTPQATHTAVTCLKNFRWWYVVVSLVFTAVILLVTVIFWALKCHEV